MNARLVEVIETDLYEAGDGTREHPYRRLTQYWSKDGVLLAVVDPCRERIEQQDAEYLAALHDAVREVLAAASPQPVPAALQRLGEVAKVRP